jgi:hypothetical protein
MMKERAPRSTRRSASSIGLLVSLLAALVGMVLLGIYYPGRESRLVGTEPTVKKVKILTIPSRGRTESP